MRKGVSKALTRIKFVSLVLSNWYLTSKPPSLQCEELNYLDYVFLVTKRDRGKDWCVYYTLFLY